MTKLKSFLMCTPMKCCHLVEVPPNTLFFLEFFPSFSEISRDSKFCRRGGPSSCECRFAVTSVTAWFSPPFFFSKVRLFCMTQNSFSPEFPPHFLDPASCSLFFPFAIGDYLFFPFLTLIFFNISQPVEIFQGASFGDKPPSLSPLAGPSTVFSVPLSLDQIIASLIPLCLVARSVTP